MSVLNPVSGLNIVMKDGNQVYSRYTQEQLDQRNQPIGPTIPNPKDVKSPSYQVVKPTPPESPDINSYLNSIAEINAQNSLIRFDNKLIDYNNNLVEAKNAQIEQNRQLATSAFTRNAEENAIIRLSNRDVAKQNIASNKKFTDYLSEQSQLGNTIDILDTKGNIVGKTSGPRSYHDVLSAEKKYGNVSVKPEMDRLVNIEANTSGYVYNPRAEDIALREYIQSNTAKGATFEFKDLAGNTIGETSGPRSYHDYLAVQKVVGSVSIVPKFTLPQTIMDISKNQNPPISNSINLGFGAKVPIPTSISEFSTGLFSRYGSFPFESLAGNEKFFATLPTKTQNIISSNISPSLESSIVSSTPNERSLSYNIGSGVASATLFLPGTGGLIKGGIGLIANPIKSAIARSAFEASVSGRNVGIMRMEYLLSKSFRPVSSTVKESVKTAKEAIKPYAQVTISPTTKLTPYGRRNIPLSNPSKEQLAKGESYLAPSNFYLRGYGEKIGENAVKTSIPNPQDVKYVQGPTKYAFKIEDMFAPRTTTEKPQEPFLTKSTGGLYFNDTNLAYPNRPAASGISPYTPSIKTTTGLDVGNFLFTPSGKPSSTITNVSTGQISSEYFEKTVPNANNIWYTNRGNEIGIGYFATEQPIRRKNIANLTISTSKGFLKRSRKGQLVLSESNRIIASGKSPINDILRVNLPETNKSPLKRYVRRSDILGNTKQGRAQQTENISGLTYSKSLKLSNTFNPKTYSITKNVLGFKGGHIKNFYPASKSAVNPAFQMLELIKNPPTGFAENKITRYTTTSERLSNIPTQKGGQTAKGYGLTRFALRESWQNYIQSGGTLTPKLPDLNLAPRGKRPETAIETERGNALQVKFNKNYEPNRNLWNPSLGGRLATGKSPLQIVPRSEEFTSNLLSPEEQALRERYPFMTNTLSEAPKPKALKIKVGELGTGTSPIRGFTSKFEIPGTGRIENITHRPTTTKNIISALSNNYNTKPKKVSVKPQPFYSNQSISNYKQLGSRERPSGEYRINLRIHLGKKVLNIGLGKKTYYTTKKSQKFDYESVLGVSYKPTDEAFGELWNKLIQNRKNFTGKNITDYRKLAQIKPKVVRNYEETVTPKSKFVHHGTLEDKVKDLETGGYTKDYFKSRIGEIKPDLSNYHNIGAKQVLAEQKQKIVPPKEKPQIFGVPELNPSREYGTFFVGEPPHAKEKISESIKLNTGISSILSGLSIVSFRPAIGQSFKPISSLSLANISATSFKQGSKLGTRNAELLSYSQKLEEYQIFKPAYKQDQVLSFKQTSKQILKTPLESIFKQEQKQVPKQTQKQKYTYEEPPPLRKGRLYPPFGRISKTKKKVRKTLGPTRTYLHEVNNVFASSLGTRQFKVGRIFK